MRTDSARLAVALCLCVLSAGCHSNWDWWRSSKRSTPGGSAMAGGPPPYQPTLPSAAPQGGAAGASPSGVASYPSTGYPAGPGAAGTTLSTTAPGGSGYPLASRNATTPAWPPTGSATGGTSVTSPYPNPAANSFAQTAPAPASVYPSTSTPGAAIAPQAGPYSGNYTGASDALAKAPAADASGANRYAGDTSTGDRYASNPNAATRYDVTAATPSDRTAAAGAPSTDRYGAPINTKDAYNPGASYVNTGAPPIDAVPTAPSAADRYTQPGTGLPPAGGAGSAAPAGGAVPARNAAIPPIAKPTSDRYGSGVGAEPAPGVDRYPAPGSDLYPPAGTEQPPVGSPPSGSQNLPGEYQPGSIRRYNPPMGTTSNDIQNFHFFASCIR